MKELTENMGALVRSEAILLLQFGADDCGPCHAIRFKLDQWLETHAEVTARYVDIAKNLELCAQMGVFSAPTVIVYMGGQLVAKESGYFSLDALLDRVERYLALREADDHGKAQPARRVLCFGDSNTYGYDPRSYFGSQYPADVRWTGLLQSAGWEVANCGQNGLCIPVEAQFATVTDLICRVNADVITVMLGSNDLLNGSSAAEAAEKMDALLRCMKENHDAAGILLIAPPPMRLGDWVQTRALIDESARLAGLYRAAAEKTGVLFADAGGWNVDLAFDGVHFSPKGHAAFAAGLMEVLSGMN